MSQELQTDGGATGLTVYFLLRNATGSIWNGAAFVTYVTENYATYIITATEQATSGYYVGSIPTSTAGIYYSVAKQQIGGSPAESDPSIGWGDIQWAGTVTLPLSNIAASGVPVAVLSGQLSGQLITAASGLFGTASLNSGQFVLVYSGQLSGQQVNLLSGNQVGVWSGTQVNVFSGALSGQLVNAASGGFGTASLNSGQSVLVYSGQLSGQLVNLLSGNQVGVWSGTQINVFSGSLSGQPISLLSGQVVLIASGNLSGQIVSVPSGLSTISTLYSGQTTLVYSGQLSGQQVNLLSGNSVSVWSGTSVNVFSGCFVNIFSGSLSGQPITILSGSLSGQQVAIVSGTFINFWSGQSVVASLWSGQQTISVQNLDKSGYVLAGNGLDLVQVESGLPKLNARQALSIIAASTAGQFSGAGTTSVSMDGAGVSGTERIGAIVDLTGNRLNVTILPPA